MNLEQESESGERAGCYHSRRFDHSLLKNTTGARSQRGGPKGPGMAEWQDHWDHTGGESLVYFFFFFFPQEGQFLLSKAISKASDLVGTITSDFRVPARESPGSWCGWYLHPKQLGSCWGRGTAQHPLLNAD